MGDDLHKHGLDYLVKHLNEVDEFPEAIQFLEIEPERKLRNGNMLPMCDLIVYYNETQRPQAIGIEFKCTYGHVRHARNQLFSGREYIRQKYEVLDPRLKLVWFNKGKLEYHIVR